VLSLSCVVPVFAEQHGQIMIGGVPVPGATVTVIQGDKMLVTITDPMGVYSFPDLPDGKWPLEIEMLGFAKLKGDTSTTAWELKMLPIDEMRAEVAHNEPPPPPAGSAPAPAAANGKAANSKTPATPRGQQSGFAQTQVNQSATPANAEAANAQPQAASGQFANASQEQLNQRAADGLLINGTVNNGAASPFAQLGAFGNNRRGLRPLYNGGFGLVLDNSALDARSYSLNGAPTPKPSYNNGTFSFNFGGPIKIPGITHNNGPNFFVGAQRVQNRTVRNGTGLMPTDLQRKGDFSQTVNQFGQPVQIIDPDTGQPFSGNLITNRISPQAQALLPLFPLPNFTGNSRYNYQIPLVQATHQEGVQTRINKGINQKNQVFGDFAMQATHTDNPNIFSFQDKNRVIGINTSINWTNRPTQRFSAQFGYRFSRQSTNVTPYFANQVNVAGLAGITGNNQDPVNWGPSALTFLGGTTSMFDAQSSSARNETNTVSYNSFWGHGRHSITFGGDLRRQEFNTISQQDARGTFTITGARTALVKCAYPDSFSIQVPSNNSCPYDATHGGQPLASTVPGTGYDFADFLLGLPSGSSIAFGNADKYLRQTVYDAFFEDQWRISGALTLMLGARWEFETPISEKYKRLVNLNIAKDFSSAPPVVGNDLINSNGFDIMPRLAFAWRPIAASSVIVRGSYGVYRNTGVYQSIATQMAQQYPLSKSLNVQTSPANSLTLANGFNATPGVTPNTFAVDPNFKIGYAQNWTLNVQRDLPFALQMTALYMGTKGTRLPQEYLPNTFPAGAISPSGYIFLTSNGNSYRHAGQIQLRRRLRSGFTSSLQYTYAKAIDDAPLMGGNQVATVSQAGANVAQNWLNLSGERALSSFDQRHQLQVQGQYTSGSGVRGGALLSGWKGTLLKEWTLASALTMGTGTPQTPTTGGLVPGTGVSGNLRPNATGLSITAAPAGFFLNPAAYQAPAAGQWGNAARNSITGPAQFSMTGTLGRTFPWGDRFNIDLRVDAQNVLNHVAYTSWITNINSAQFGLPANTNQMRILQTTVRVRF
jgi:hypothetical protein